METNFKFEIKKSSYLPHVKKNRSRARDLSEKISIYDVWRLSYHPQIMFLWILAPMKSPAAKSSAPVALDPALQHLNLK
jgi:hypothetical protein